MTSISNSLDRNQNFELSSQQSATAAAGPATMQVNAPRALQRFAAIATCRVTCCQSVSAARMLQQLLEVLEVLAEVGDIRSRLHSRDLNCCHMGRKPRREEELRRVCSRRCLRPMQELFQKS